MRITKQIDRNRLYSKIILFVISVLFLAVFAITTSPLTDFYGWDSAFFMVVGQGMTEGLLPYRDFFDMKGPFLFIIEYIGQLLCWGRTGCFLIEIIHLTASLWIIDEIFRLASGNRFLRIRWLFYLPVLLIASFSFEFGNLTEEYSLPWLLFSVYLVFQYYVNSENTGNFRHPVWMGLYHGIAFGIMAMIRITNAAVIGAILLSVTVGLLAGKQFLNLFYNGCAFILGTALAILPICLWCHGNGILPDMLDQVFLFGFQYSSETDIHQKLNDIYQIRHLFLPAVVPAVVAAMLRIKSWRIWLFCIVSFLIGSIALCMGYAYVHYFTLLIPNLVFGFALFLKYLPDRKNNQKIKSIILALFLSVMCIMMVKNPSIIQTYKGIVNGYVDREWHHFELEQAKDIIDQVPDGEKHLVFAYGNSMSCSKWYALAGYYPPYKYCDWHQGYINMRSEVGTEIADWLENDGCWIVTTRDYVVSPEQIADVVSENFTEVYTNDIYKLYRSNKS